MTIFWGVKIVKDHQSGIILLVDLFVNFLDIIVVINDTTSFNITIAFIASIVFIVSQHINLNIKHN
jgi:hypothetical protein